MAELESVLDNFGETYRNYRQNAAIILATADCSYEAGSGKRTGA
jgi:hypothetical protein